jgi:hypothetical protein
MTRHEDLPGADHMTAPENRERFALVLLIDGAVIYSMHVEPPRQDTDHVAFHTSDRLQQRPPRVQPWAPKRHGGYLHDIATLERGLCPQKAVEPVGDARRY